MNIAKKIGLSYLKGIDATIRLVGSYLIMCLFIVMIYGVFWGLSYILPLSFDHGTVTGIFSIMLLPFIIRFGLLAGGLLVPPIFTSKSQESWNHSNK